MPYYMRMKSSGGGTGKLRTLRRKLDKVFSEYIRLRDSRAYDYTAFRCISCGQVKPCSQADCGHYISRTAMATRWDEDNCHAECRSCNRFSADHLIGYGRNLERMMGHERLCMMLARGQMQRKWSAFELEVLLRHYTEEVARMKAEAAKSGDKVDDGQE